MAVTSWIRLQPFYHHRQTHGELWDSEDWNTFVEPKQHMKASCLGPWERCLYFQKFCNQGVRQFVYSISCQPPQGRWAECRRRLPAERRPAVWWTISTCCWGPATQGAPNHHRGDPYPLIILNAIWNECQRGEMWHSESFHDPSN